MAKPRPPTKAAVDAAEKAKPGGGAELFDLYRDACRREEDRKDLDRAERAAEAWHVRVYRYLSILAALTVAVLGLGVFAYGTHQRVDVGPLAGLFGSLSTLVGVFVYAYKPAGPRVGR